MRVTLFDIGSWTNRCSRHSTGISPVLAPTTFDRPSVNHLALELYNCHGRVLVCIKRRIAIFRRLQRIHKGSATRGVGEAPKVCQAISICTYRMLTVLQQVVDFITQEYARSALIAYESIPKNVVQEGWGRPSKCPGCFPLCFCDIVQ